MFFDDMMILYPSIVTGNCGLCPTNVAFLVKTRTTSIHSGQRTSFQQNKYASSIARVTLTRVLINQHRRNTTSAGNKDNDLPIKDDISVDCSDMLDRIIMIESTICAMQHYNSVALGNGVIFKVMY